MIAYVDCLSTEPSTKCWNRRYYEDEDELLPLYTRRLQPKTEGSLRRRLLTHKIYQQQDALWAPRPLAGPIHNKGTPLLQPRRPPNPTPVHVRQEWSRGRGLFNPPSSITSFSFESLPDSKLFPFEMFPPSEQVLTLALPKRGSQSLEVLRKLLDVSSSCVGTCAVFTFGCLDCP